VVSFVRRGCNPEDTLLVVCNFTPVLRENYLVGVPSGGYWHEVLNSDTGLYGGSGKAILAALKRAPSLPVKCIIH